MEEGALAVLDIGCGHGAFLREARAAGCRVAGIEINAAAVRSCTAAGLSVRHGSLFDVDLPAGPWDVITFWDVFEHLEHPREALARVTRTLAPGGLLVLRGRHAGVHASLKVLQARMEVPLARLGLPQVGCVHRWGFRPCGYERLLGAVGMHEVRLHPGLPTPGDRYGSLGAPGLAATIKGLAAAWGTGLYVATCRRLYPFPTVLISGRRAP